MEEIGMEGTEMSTKTSIALMMTIFIVVSIFAFIVLNGNKRGQLTIHLLDSDVEIDIQGDKKDLKDVIGEIFKDETHKIQALAILSKVYSLYDITNTIIIDAINKLGYDHQVARKFREIRDNNKGIFEMRYIEGKADFESNDSLMEGDAAVCVGNELLYGRNILLINPNDRKRIKNVFVRDPILCPDESDLNSLIKISNQDGKNLFCDINLLGKKHVIMYYAPIGYMFSPSTSGEGKYNLKCDSMG